MSLNIPNKITAGTYLNIRIALLVFIGTLSIEFLGFMLIEQLSWVDAIYMTVITFSTVGFGTVHELSEPGKLFSSLVILLNIASFAYAISVFSYYFIEGKFFKKMKSAIINKKIDKLSDHIIVCGIGRYGEEIIGHFITQKIDFVIIERDPERIIELEDHFGKLLFIEEDATQDDVLIDAGIKRANALISALPDDSDNVYTVLSARQLNPDIKIISRAYEAKSIKKLKLAGASHVIMPEQIGGFYMATLISKPDAVEFFSFIANDLNSDFGFEEIHFEELPQSFRNKSIKETKIRVQTGANIIGCKHPDGSYEANPNPDTRFVENSSFIFLGNTKQLDSLRALIENNE